MASSMSNQNQGCSRLEQYLLTAAQRAAESRSPADPSRENIIGHMGEVIKAWQDAGSPKDCWVVDSPMLGMLYRSPGPSDPFYVEVGSTVQPGETVFQVEAMKVISEIPCDTDQPVEVVAIFGKHEKLVHAGQPLMLVKAIVTSDQQLATDISTAMAERPPLE